MRGMPRPARRRVQPWQVPSAASTSWTGVGPTSVPRSAAAHPPRGANSRMRTWVRYSSTSDVDAPNVAMGGSGALRDPSGPVRSPSRADRPGVAQPRRYPLHSIRRRGRPNDAPTCSGAIILEFSIKKYNSSRSGRLRPGAPGRPRPFEPGPTPALWRAAPHCSGLGHALRRPAAVWTSLRSMLEWRHHPSPPPDSEWCGARLRGARAWPSRGGREP